jgi:hypothetical protein
MFPNDSLMEHSENDPLPIEPQFPADEYVTESDSLNIPLSDDYPSHPIIDVDD